jgi:dihydrofolate reductase
MISTFIIAAVSKDGFIARNAKDNPFNWTSEEDKESFISLTKDAGVVIVGSKTFETFPRPLRDRLNIVYSRSWKFEGENVETTSDKPRALLGKLERRGYKKAAIIGGAEIYNMFFESGMVSKIYLTVEPIEFGTGIPFFKGNIEDRFKLVKEKTVGSGTLFKEYEKR